MSVDYGVIRAQVEQYLPILKNESEEELLASIGQFVYQAPVLGGVEGAGPQHPYQGRGVDHDTVQPGMEGGLTMDPVQAGRIWLVQMNQAIRGVICNPDNQKLIDMTVSPTNVTLVVAMLAPVLGFSLAAVPISGIALAILLLKVGINAYCRGFTPGLG